MKNIIEQKRKRIWTLILGLAIIQLAAQPVEALAADAELIEYQTEQTEESVDLPESADELPASIELDTEELKLTVGSTATMSATVRNQKNELISRELDWTSDSPDIVEVDDAGNLTAKAWGEATITVRTGDVSAECIVIVENPITDLQLKDQELILEEEQKAHLHVDIFPADSSEDKELLWSSSNISVVVVDAAGEITAVKEGQADIIVSTKNGKISAACHVTVSPKPGYTGWEKTKYGWYYYINGDRQTGWQEIGDRYYYLDANGVMQTGWVYVNKSWYYLNGDGERQSGWLKQNRTWYYLDGNGVMQTGRAEIKGITYIFNKSGAMQTGWSKQGNVWYYLDGSGAMKTGWLKLKNIWYYLNKDGVMQTGWLKLGSTWYYLNGSGAMQTGWLKLSGVWYYLNGSGAMQTGWLKLGKTWYYLNENGAMQTGWLKLGSTWYYLNENGAMKTGWLKLGNTWYYLDGSGAMQTGWLKLGNMWYYLNGSGAMQTGWLKLNGVWYYLNKSGAMQTGWQTIDGVRYYFRADGSLQGGGGSGSVIFKNGDVFQLNECAALSHEGNKITVTLSAARKSALENMGESFYIVLLNSDGTKLVDVAKGNISKKGSFRIEATFVSKDSFQTAMMGKYGIAVESGPAYQVISNTMFLSNPEITASKEENFKDYYWGYYEGYKVTSKKGIQGVDPTYTADLQVQHVLLNVDLQDLVWTAPASGYIPYKYKGKTYFFSDLIALKKTVYDLHGWGSSEGNAYGENINRNVTVVLLMSWKYDALSYLIHPDARQKGAASYYALNMREEKARETFEALFCYLGEELGQMKRRVHNWTLGNEVNSCNVWNYSGGMSLENCVENYAQAFQLLNQGVKRTASSPRLFISLDHCWNTSDAGHSGKAFLDQFARYMNRTVPAMQWNVNYHPYSQPLHNSSFWSDTSNTINSVGTGYISMKNIQVLTNYLSSLETAYGKTSNSIRVILGEIGYSGNGGTSERLQAAALGYGYYIAMFNKRIDSYIIRAYMDDPVETASGLYLGLRKNDRGQTVKEAYPVYKYLDTSKSLSYMNHYLNTIGISSWQSAIPGFQEDNLVAGND